MGELFRFLQMRGKLSTHPLSGGWGGVGWGSLAPTTCVDSNGAMHFGLFHFALRHFLLPGPQFQLPTQIILYKEEHEHNVAVQNSTFFQKN